MPGIVLGPEGSFTEDCPSRVSCMLGPLLVTWVPGPSVRRGQDGVLGSPGLAQATGLQIDLRTARGFPAVRVGVDSWVLRLELPEESPRHSCPCRIPEGERWATKFKAQLPHCPVLPSPHLGKGSSSSEPGVWKLS